MKNIRGQYANELVEREVGLMPDGPIKTVIPGTPEPEQIRQRVSKSFGGQKCPLFFTKLRIRMEQNYFDVKAMSASAIKAGAKSMHNMEMYLKYGISETSAMKTGTLFHMALLEPERFSQMVVCDSAKNTNIFKEAAASSLVGAISSKDKLKHEIQVANIMNHPLVREYGLFVGGKSEVEYYWQESGIDCKCKRDWENDDFIVEYKSCQSIRKFLNNAASMFYHLQLGWYSRPGKPKKMLVVAQESDLASDVAVYEINPLLIGSWFDDCMKIVTKYQSGDRSGAYPNLLSFEVPVWAEADQPEEETDPEKTIGF